VVTNTKDKKELYLNIKGQVEFFAKITPTSIRLTGAPDDEIKRQVMITPSEKYDFVITGVKLQSGKDVEVEFKQVSKEKKSWQIDVYNKRKAVGRYYDVIFVKTDNSIRPELRISVYGNIVSMKSKSAASAE